MWGTKLRALFVASFGTLIGYTGVIDTSNFAAAAAEASKGDGASVANQTSVVADWADGVLKEMGDYLKSAGQFSVHAEVTFDSVLPSGQKLQFGASIDAAVRRPDRLYAEYDGDLAARRFWYDGKNFTLLDLQGDVYASEPSPSTVDATLDHMMEAYGFSLPLADFVFSDPYASLIENVQFGIYVGQHTVDGARVHHLAFVEKYIDWQVWIEDGKRPVPRKIVITYKTLPGSPQYTAVLSEWDLSTRLPDSLFTVDAPAIGQAEQIEFLRQPKTAAGQN